MSIVTLELYCKEIAKASSTMYLSAVRAKLQGLLKNNDISIGIYQGLNRDIRNRADWLKGRK